MVGRVPRGARRETRRRRPARPGHTAALGTMGGGDRSPPWPRAARSEALPPWSHRLARRTGRGGRPARGRSRRAGLRQGRGPGAGGLSRESRPDLPRRRRVRSLARSLRARCRGDPRAESDHTSWLPRRTRDLAPRRATPARALRRRRSHPPRRRRASATIGGTAMNERELIERYNQAWNDHDVEAATAMHAPDIVFHNYSSNEREGLVVSEWTATATKDGRKFEWDGIDIFPIEDGLIKRKDVYSGFGVAREVS